MIFAHLGGRSPQEHRPLGACSIDRIPFVSRTKPRATDPQPTAAAHGTAADPPALELQRIRERLELAAIVAGCNYPEQTAAALLGEGVRQ